VHSAPLATIIAAYSTIDPRDLAACMNSPPPSKWSLSRQAFEQLLDRLGPDREAASGEYEEIRRRLIHFFDWRGSPSADVEADTTLDRIARKLEAGEVIENIHSYVRTVARYVLQESQRRAMRQRTALEAAGTAEPSVPAPDSEGVHMPCLRACLSELPEDSRALLLAYYHGEGRIHLEERKSLAARLGVTYEALKKRAHRARTVLEDCVRRCVDGRADPR
jgi:DNA-directed RNA polymerase specialized sigma24 family protein